jgi:hypothetical protein
MQILRQKKAKALRRLKMIKNFCFLLRIKRKLENTGLFVFLSFHHSLSSSLNETHRLTSLSSSKLYKNEAEEIVLRSHRHIHASFPS